MSRFGFLGRKTAADEKPVEPTAETKNPLEIDDELFSGAQLGGENEALRGLLFHANSKIGELDSIKAAVSRLVDPVSKALLEFEAEKTERAGLQTVLNNTRTAYGKLRNEVGDLEKNLTLSEQECQTLRQDLASAQSLLQTLESNKTDYSIELASARALIGELESNLAQRTGEALALREENRRFDERLVAAEKRAIAIESDLAAARQRLLVAEDEKRAQHSQLDKAGTESARVSRKLAEANASLSAAQSRLRQVEETVNEGNIERARLVTTVDELNERHERELTSHTMRFDSLQARAATLEKVVADARELLLARAEQIREYDRRMADMIAERDATQERAATLQAALIEIESKFKEADQTRSAYMERNETLARAFTAKEAALRHAEEANVSLIDRVRTLETARAAEKQASDQKIDGLEATLRREKTARALAEGALETARRDYAKAMREVMALERKSPPDDTERPRAANAA